MNKVLQLVGILAAFATGGLLLAYIFVGETARPWVLYYAVCSLGLTVAIIGLLVANAFEVIVGYMRRTEQERQRQRGPNVR